MTIFQVTTQQQQDDYSVITTLVNNEISVGESIIVGSMATDSPTEISLFTSVVMTL